MLFSSITFIYYFLPIVLLLYYVVPHRMKNVVLFLSSLLFYAWGEPKYVFLMLGSVLIGYIAGLCMDCRFKKAVLVVSIGLCLLSLIYFKYTDFLVNNINIALQTEIPLLKLVLPIGISFYTFQIISYIIDVYRGQVEKQRNFLILATYISMFPQLIAGPIVRYSDINEQLVNKRIRSDEIANGIVRFVIGLSKKVLIANQLGELCQIFRDSEEKTILFYWLYAVSVALHVYFDFSGYSDMAIGLGKLLGFSFPENFRYPFMSKSATEFWRRWHMSLGNWFRDYVYIPLGGNRKGLAKQIFNIFFVWILTGLWHGAQWNFVIWGLFFAILLMMEKMWLYERLQASVIWSRVYMFFVVTISFVIFNATDMGQLFMDIENLFFLGNVSQMSVFGNECLYYLRSYGSIISVAILGATDLPTKCYLRIREQAGVKKLLVVLEPMLILGMLLVSTAYLVDGSFNPFLYFRF